MVKANVTATNICLTCNVRYQKYVFKMFFKASPESTPLIFLPCQHQPKSTCQIKQQIFPRPHDSGNIRFATI